MSNFFEVGPVCKVFSTKFATSFSNASHIALRWSARRLPLFSIDMLLRWSKEASLEIKTFFTPDRLTVSYATRTHIPQANGFLCYRAVLFSGFVNILSKGWKKRGRDGRMEEWMGGWMGRMPIHTAEVCLRHG